MSNAAILCPHCQKPVPAAMSLPPGAPVQCPGCGSSFPVPAISADNGPTLVPLDEVETPPEELPVLTPVYNEAPQSSPPQPQPQPQPQAQAQPLQAPLYPGGAGAYGAPYTPPMQAGYGGAYGGGAYGGGAYGPAQPGYGGAYGPPPATSNADRRVLIGISAVAAGLVLLLLVVVGGGVAAWMLFRNTTRNTTRSTAQYDPAAKVAPQAVAESPSAVAMPTSASPAANQPVSPTQPVSSTQPERVGQLPPLPAGVGATVNEVQPNLQYNWNVGQEFGCYYSINVTVGNETRIISGLTSYKPTSEDPATIDVPQEEQAGEGTGTAFVVHPQGVLVTCAHVVEGASEITVATDGTPHPAKVIALDVRKDLALLKIDASPLRYLPLADSDGVQLAQQIRAVGYPLTDVLGESIKMTAGEVSGVIERSGSKLIQIDATVNPGNSGGPVVDSQGRVVGVASNLMAGSDIASMGFAVPANEVRRLLEKSKVPYSQTGAAQPLVGTELASRVTPSVMLVKVKFGRGGVGSSQQQVVEFNGYFSTRTEVNGRISAGSVGVPVHDRGKLLVDRFGEVAFQSGQASLPLMMGQVGGMGIELLPSDDSRTWQTLRVTAVTKVKKSPSSNSPYGSRLSPYSRYGRRFGGAPPSSTTVQVIPAIEQVDYAITSESGDNVIIKKTHRLTSIHKDGETPYLDLQGEGTVTFDRVLGMPRKMDFEGTMSVSEGTVVVRVPFNMEYHVADPQEFAEKMAEARAKNEAQAEARRKAEQEQANRPKVRQIDPPAATVEAPRPSSPAPQPTVGLDKFDPNS